jgi:hypothetical protein
MTAYGVSTQAMLAKETAPASNLRHGVGETQRQSRQRRPHRRAGAGGVGREVEPEREQEYEQRLCERRVLEKHLGPIERHKRGGQQSQPGRTSCPADGQKDEQRAGEPEEMLQRDDPRQVGREDRVELAQEQRISHLASRIDPQVFACQPNVGHGVGEPKERRPPREQKKQAHDSAREQDQQQPD